MWRYDKAKNNSDTGHGSATKQAKKTASKSIVRKIKSKKNKKLAY